MVIVLIAVAWLLMSASGSAFNAQAENCAIVKLFVTMKIWENYEQNLRKFMGENLRKIMRYALCPVTTIIIATTTTTTRRYCQEISWFVQFYFLLIITIWMRGEIGLKCKRNHSLCSCHSHTSRLRMRWMDNQYITNCMDACLVVTWCCVSNAVFWISVFDLA